MFRKLLITILSICSFFSAGVFAVGLGEIKQSSGLNQHLNAEIPLLSAGDLAEYELLASLASNSEFEKLGVDRVFFLNNIKFKTTRDANDNIVIKVTTHKVVKEPFLNFIVELNWPNGRILREYTLLLDPPIYEQSQSSTIESAVSTTVKKKSNQRQVQSSNTSIANNQGIDENSDNYQSSSSSTSYGPVSNTDTLWSIASKTRPDRSVSIHQTLVAIYRANPHAFAKGNINNLLKGKVLTIPSAKEIENVPQRAALQDVVMQNKQWRSGGARKIVSNGQTSKKSQVQTSNGSRLSLSTAVNEGSAEGYGSDTGANSKELAGVRNELIRTQEEAATLQAENDALRDRLAEIMKKAEENQVSNTVNINDSELAALSEISTNDSDEMTKVASEQLKDSTEENIIEEKPVNKDNSLEDASIEKTAEKNTSTLPKVFKAKKKESSFVQEFLDNTLLLWGSIGLLILVVLMGVFWKMKKRMEDDDFQDDLVASAGAGSMDTTETFELPDVGDDMLVELDMDDGDVETNTPDESFDPIGEADIYIAYGKHEQAEILLLEAIEDNPVRADLKVKLMECYSETDNQDKFEELAKDVAESVDADEWYEQVSNLRVQAWGENTAEEESNSFDLPSTEDIFGDDDDELDVDFLDSKMDDDTNHEQSELVISEEEVEAETDDFEDIDLSDVLNEDDDLLDLDELDDLDSLSEAEESEEDSSINFEELDLDDDFSINEDELSLDTDDLNLDLSEDDSVNIDELNKENDVSGELLVETNDSEELEDFNMEIEDDFSFDDDDNEINFDENMDSDEDEIATKLDLARAYVDMGDNEGANEILQEVVSEGNEEQKNEAQALMDKNS